MPTCPHCCDTRLQPQALAFVAMEHHVPFPDSCVPFRTSLPWNASLVLVPVTAATTSLGTPPAQQSPPCANSLFAFCLSRQTLSSLKAVATYYSLLSSGLAPPKIKDINGPRNGGVTRALLPVAYQGQPSARAMACLGLQGRGVVKQPELSLGPRSVT